MAALFHWRFRGITGGGHVHVTLSVGRNGFDSTHGVAGTFTLRADEWQDLVTQMGWGRNRGEVEMILDDKVEEVQHF